MGNGFRFHKNQAQAYRHFVAQKLLIEQHFQAFKCDLRGGVLQCIGCIQPTDFSSIYRIRVRSEQDGIPQVRILEPQIEPSTKIHIYKSGNLCLYHPPSQPWSADKNLHETIIPWTAEWLVFYELYLIERRWLGPEILHD